MKHLQHGQKGFARPLRDLARYIKVIGKDTRGVGYASVRATPKNDMLLAVGENPGLSVWLGIHNLGKSGKNLRDVGWLGFRKPDLLGMDEHVGSFGTEPHTPRGRNPDLTLPATGIDGFLEFVLEGGAVIIRARLPLALPVVGADKNMGNIGGVVLIGHWSSPSTCSQFAQAGATP